MVTPRSTDTCPSSGGSSPVIMRKSVVLPAPLGPTRPTFSPLASAADASTNSRCWPFCLDMLSNRIISRAGSMNVCGGLMPRDRRRKRGKMPKPTARLQTFGKKRRSVRRPAKPDQGDLARCGRYCPIDPTRKSSTLPAPRFEGGRDCRASSGWPQVTSL
jgi:hypothetical protein